GRWARLAGGGVDEVEVAGCLVRRLTRIGQLDARVDHSGAAVRHVCQRERPPTRSRADQEQERRSPSPSDPRDRAHGYSVLILVKLNVMLSSGFDLPPPLETSW